MFLNSKPVKAYIILTALVITGLLTSIVTANKIVHFGINFPFSNIVYASQNKFNLFFGSIIFKIIISVLMTPIVYLIILRVNQYLGFNTLAFKDEKPIIIETIK